MCLQNPDFSPVQMCHLRIVLNSYLLGLTDMSCWWDRALELLHSASVQ